VLIAALAAPSGAQQPPLHTTAREVLLDLTVRDKKNRLVRDLKPAEIEVYEDGARRSLASFRLVEAVDFSGEQTGGRRQAVVPGATPAATPAAAPSSGRSADEIAGATIVSLVFDRPGSPDARRLAREAAREFVTSGMAAGTWAGIFVLDARLYMLQPYTTDRDLLLEKIDQATQGAPALFRAVSDQFEIQLRSSLNKGAFKGGQASLGPPEGTVALSDAIQHSRLRQEPVEGDTVALPASAEVAGPRPILDMLVRVFDYERRTYPAASDRANLYALAALIREQAALPGRKTMLLLSEGLQVPIDFAYVLRAAISEANRANVTIYALDVRGLTREGTTFEGRSELAAASAASAAMIVNVYENDFRIFERAEASLAASSRAVLRDLTESTGGFFAADTNDFRAPIHRVIEETRSHYELSYVPPSTEYDGRFRHIEVRLTRPGLRAQTRKGYFALPVLHGHTVFPYEAPMLAALNAPARPSPFEFHVAAVPFRSSGGLAEAVAVFEVPRTALTLARPDGTKAYHTRVSFLALIKDARGEVLEKITRDIALEVPLDRREAFERGNIVFTQPFRLPPGGYTMEAAVNDAGPNRVSVRKAEIDLPPPATLALSGLVLARQVEGLEEKADPSDPLQFEDQAVTPAISGTFRRASNSEVSLYCTVYAGPAQPGPELTVEFLKGGHPASRTNAQLAAAGDGGAIPYLLRLKTSDFESGRYEAVVTVRHAGREARRSTVFTVY
jgi:VWFA-related protein